MPAGFKLEPRVRAIALYDKADLLYAAKLRLIDVRYLYPPASRLGVHRVHSEQVGREEHPLFPADTAAYLHDNVLRVVRILGQKQELHLLRQLCHSGLSLGVLLLRKLAQFRIVHQLERRAHVRLSSLILTVRPDDRRKLPRLTFAARVQRGVGVSLRFLHAALELLILIFQYSEFIEH